MELLQTIRTSILMAFRALPILLISFTAFLAIGLGNLGMFILFFGQAVLVPIVTELTHVVTAKLYPQGSMSGSAFITGSDIVQLVPSLSSRGPTNVMPSYWMEHILFFLGYLLANGVGILTLPAADQTGLSEYLIENRKAKAKTVIAMTVVAAIVLTVLRFRMSGAETYRGIAVALITGGALGYGWYQFAALCGARHADVFGVVPTILPSSAKDETPMTCVYAPKS